MNIRESVKPITYLKNRTAELVEQVARTGRPVLITQKGEARVVVMDVETYSRWREALAMLRLLGQSEADVAAGRTVPQREALARVRKAAKPVR